MIKVLMAIACAAIMFGGCEKKAADTQKKAPEATVAKTVDAETTASK